MPFLDVAEVVVKFFGRTSLSKDLFDSAGIADVEVIE